MTKTLNELTQEAHKQFKDARTGTPSDDIVARCVVVIDCYKQIGVDTAPLEKELFTYCNVGNLKYSQEFVSKKYFRKSDCAMERSWIEK